jgi:hypothetical protein
MPAPIKLAIPTRIKLASLALFESGSLALINPASPPYHTRKSALIDRDNPRQFRDLSCWEFAARAVPYDLSFVSYKL